MRRRAFVASLAWPFAARAVDGQAKIALPRDEGAHPDSRTEWWYLTGWLGDSLGFQVTFFRFRRDEDTTNPSAFTPRQILLAHAALADPRRGRLVHDERAAREGFSLAQAERGRASVWIDDWRLEQVGDGYRVHLPGREFDFDLSFAGGGLVFQGDGGVSRKGFRPAERSFYYSRPQLRVAGKLSGRAVEGLAWLDHEWSDAYVPPEASGWDWTGLNLADGGSVMAFRMRAKAGGVHYAPPGDSFTPLRTWRSPRTGIEYPVEMRVRHRDRELTLKPLIDDQEFDARASTGLIYWEGAVRAYEAGKEAGRGYLELTGYGEPMKL